MGNNANTENGVVLEVLLSYAINSVDHWPGWSINPDSNPDQIGKVEVSAETYISGMTSWFWNMYLLEQK